MSGGRDTSRGSPRRSSRASRVIRLLHAPAAAACVLFFAERAPAQEASDAGVRPRLGIGANLNFFNIFPALSTLNPGFGFDGRLGIVFKNQLAIYFNASVALGLLDASDPKGEFFSMNSLLLGLIPVDTFELALGPAADVIVRRRCAGECSTGPRLSPGFHVRLAGIIPRRAVGRRVDATDPYGFDATVAERREGRRRGISIGLEFQAQTFEYSYFRGSQTAATNSLPAFLACSSVGFEWY